MRPYALKQENNAHFATANLSFSSCKKSQAKPIFALFACIILLSYAAFAESYVNGIGNESANITARQITKIIDFIFNASGASATLALENNTPVSNQELQLYGNETYLASNMTDSSGRVSIGYPLPPGTRTYNVSVFFPGTENLYPASAFGELAIGNSTNFTANSTGADGGGAEDDSAANAAGLCLNAACPDSCNGTTLLKGGYCENATGACNYVQEDSPDCGYAVSPQAPAGKFIAAGVFPPSVIAGEIYTISARLSDENSTPLSGRELKFYEGETYIGSGITGPDGTASYPVNTTAHAAGNHTVNATYETSWNTSAVEIREPAAAAQNMANITVGESAPAQGPAEIGRPVWWSKNISVKNRGPNAEAPAVSISVGGAASEVRVKEIGTGRDVALKPKGAGKSGSMGASSVSAGSELEFEEALQPSEEKEYEVTYLTPAPEKTEGASETTRTQWKKSVTVHSGHSYKNVLSYTDIREAEIPRIHLFWNVNGFFTDVTYNSTLNLTYQDTNSNGGIDRIYWTVPHLSAQEFEVVVDLTVINVQSYPTVGGNWTVMFNTTGTADLVITAINGTTLGSSPPNDLEFLDVSCGDNSLKKQLVFTDSGGNNLTYYYFYDLYATRDEIVARIAELNGTINALKGN